MENPYLSYRLNVGLFVRLKQLMHIYTNKGAFNTNISQRNSLSEGKRTETGNDDLHIIYCKIAFSNLTSTDFTLFVWIWKQKYHFAFLLSTESFIYYDNETLWIYLLRHKYRMENKELVKFFRRKQGIL